MMRGFFRAWVLCAVVLVTGWLAISAQTNQEKPVAEGPSGADLREEWERPVISFTRGPAQLLLRPEERVLYDSLEANFKRAEFIESFFATMARNCPPGVNTSRTLLWERSAEALKKFAGEGIPGWLTDRGRFFVLLGPPAKEETIDVKSRFGATKALIWTYPPAQDMPTTLAFIKVRTTWLFAGADITDANGKVAELNPQPVFELSERISSSWRGRGCDLSPEQRVEAAKTAWRTVLWDVTGKILEGQPPQVAEARSPVPYFFPAADNATFFWLSVPLPSALPEGSKIVALLRNSENPDISYNLGGDDFPFVVRPAGERFIAVASRAVPPGKYALALATADAVGNVVLNYAAEQLVVNLSASSLRLTSVVLAQDIKESNEVQLPGPFHIANFDLVPKPGRTIRHGESLKLFYQVLGAVTGPENRTNFKVTYQLHIKPAGKGWMKAGKPQLFPDRTGASQVWELPIPPQYPVAEYKVEIQVQDSNGATASMEVPFDVKGN